MAILATGGAGHIGSVTADYLLSRGAKVVVLDNLALGHRQALDAEVPFLSDAGVLQALGMIGVDLT